MVKKVRCVEKCRVTLEDNYLTLGKVYEVLFEEGMYYNIKNDKGVEVYVLKWRFEEVKEPTLQDLLTKAKELYDKGILRSYGEDHYLNVKTVRVMKAGSNTGRVFREEDIDKGLKYLQSLEVETFKIETVEDFKRIKRNAKIELVNGTVLRVNSIRPFTRVGTRVTVSIENPEEWGEQFDAHLTYSYLKGATVTQ